MSHFTVGIIHRRDQDINELLAPYDEGIRVEEYIKYTKKDLIKNGREDIENYKNSTYKEFLKDPEAYKESRKINNADKHIDYLENEFPKKLEWSDEEIYEHQLRYYEEDAIGENGEVYSTYNPNSKWDWYQVGGRWYGLLKLKPEATTGKLGERSWTNKDLDAPKDRADSAQIKDIDFSMDEDCYKRSIKFWELKVEGQEPKDKEEEELVKFDYYKKEFYEERYITKENYAKNQASFGTWATITPDGKWHEKGEMGWWGMSSETHEEANEWTDSWYDKFIKNTDENLYLTIVDCHI